MSTLHVKCLNCGEDMKLHSYLTKADLIGTEFEGFPADYMQRLNYGRLINGEKPLVLSSQAKFDESYDSETDTYVCLSCNERSKMVIS